MKQFSIKNKMYSFLAVSILLFAATNANAYDLIAAKDGSGRYTVVKAAAAPGNSAVPYSDIAKKYHEKILGFYTIANALPGWEPSGVMSGFGRTTFTPGYYAASEVGLLEQWPFTTNNQDSAAVRAPGIVGTVPTFNKLYVSNGTTVPSVPAYSALHGQAYGATANGDGSWGTGSGGPGSNLNRTFYQQFTITAAAGYSVRIDSVILNSVFHNTSSGTKLAIVYSKTGFTTDSADVTGTAAGLGSFANPILLTNETTTGNSVNHRIAFNGATGVSIAAGETLTFRLYNSCGSSSTGRYAKLKNLYVTGLSTPVPVTGDYRTNQSGEWTNVSTWQRFDGTNWVTPAPASPVHNNSGVVSILNGHTVTLTSNITTDQTVINSGGSLVVNPGIVLTLNDGAGTDLTVSSGGSMTLKSTVAGTASIGNSTTATIAGDVTAERYISDKRAWRLLGVPFSATSQTIKASWMEGGTSASSNPAPGYGTHITTFTDDANAANFDATKPGSSIRVYSGDSFSSDAAHTPNTTTIITANPAYFLFIRGNRSIDINSSTAHSATTLRITGIPSMGAVTKGVTGTNFSLIPNPYASAIDFDAVKAANTSINTFYVWDATMAGTNGTGQYRTVQITGSAPNYTYTATPGTASNNWRYIESGTAFFVPGSTTLNFTEAMKTAGTPPSSMLRTVSVNQTEIAVNLNVVNADNTTSLADGIRGVFDNNYSAVVDNNDAKKIAGFNMNLGISSNNEILAIEKRPLPNPGDVISLNLSGAAQGNYQFEVQPANFSGTTLFAYLKDNYLDTYTPVNLTSDTKVDFSITPDVASSSANRFSIVFTKTAISPVKSLITVYPNPVQNGVVRLLMNNMPKGIYQVRLLNALGQTVLSKQINHAEGTSIETFSVNKVKGTYTIEVTKPDNSKTNNRIIIN